MTARISRRMVGLMAEDDPSVLISRLEVLLEELAEEAERCRKIILVSKLAISVGGALLLGAVLGLLGSNAVAAIDGAMTAVLGGIVSLGSNVSTLQQTTAAMAAAEKSRSELIGRINLRLVGDIR